MTSCDTPGLLPFEDALQQLQRAIVPLTQTETVPLLTARNRVLGRPIQAPCNLPTYDNSAMDGYAFHHSGAAPTQALTIVGAAFAGAPYQGEVPLGHCVRIMTGAMVPAGCNCVVMQENTRRENDQLWLTAPCRPGDNIRQAGHELQQGSPVLAQGRRLKAVDIGMLATLGLKEVTVVARLQVAVFSTGDELTPLGQPLAQGNIYDSNRYLLLAALEALNVEVHDLGALPDDPQQIKRTFEHAARTCDAVISSGGVSVGDADFTRDILLSLGNIHFYKLAIKPGKPFAFGTLQGNEGDRPCYFFGLPGNPVSAAITFHQLALPGLKTLAGEQSEKPPTLQLRALSAFKKRPGRSEFQRGRLTMDSNGELGVASTGGQSSAALMSMVNADCYVLLERERGSVAVGEWVTVVPFSDLDR